MRVKIGPYVNWIGPYQIADKILFWIPKYKKDAPFEHTDAYIKYVEPFGDWLANDKNGNDSWLTKFCTFVHKKRKQKVKIHIDRYDTWSMDSTLALIILPMLKQLQATKHGSPSVDDDDVPEYLRSHMAQPKEYEWDTDELWHKRWEWVLGEMIFAFEKLNEEDWEQEFFKNKEWDKEGWTKINDRINNGLVLFGKYYRGLWD